MNCWSRPWLLLFLACLLPVPSPMIYSRRNFRNFCCQIHCSKMANVDVAIAIAKVHAAAAVDAGLTKLDGPFYIKIRAF
jgi:hypothetical protein